MDLIGKDSVVEFAEELVARKPRCATAPPSQITTCLSGDETACPDSEGVSDLDLWSGCSSWQSAESSNTDWNADEEDVHALESSPAAFDRVFSDKSDLGLEIRFQKSFTCPSQNSVDIERDLIVKNTFLEFRCADEAMEVDGCEEQCLSTRRPRRAITAPLTFSMRELDDEVEQCATDADDDSEHDSAVPLAKTFTFPMDKSAGAEIDIVVKHTFLEFRCTDEAVEVDGCNEECLTRRRPRRATTAPANFSMLELDEEGDDSANDADCELSEHESSVPLAKTLTYPLDKPAGGEIDIVVKHTFLEFRCTDEAMEVRGVDEGCLLTRRPRRSITAPVSFSMRKSDDEVEESVIDEDDLLVSSCDVAPRSATLDLDEDDATEAESDELEICTVTSEGIRAEDFQSLDLEVQSRDEEQQGLPLLIFFQPHETSSMQPASICYSPVSSPTSPPGTFNRESMGSPVSPPGIFNWANPSPGSPVSPPGIWSAAIAAIPASAKASPRFQPVLPQPLLSPSEGIQQTPAAKCVVPQTNPVAPSSLEQHISTGRTRESQPAVSAIAPQHKKTANKSPIDASKEGKFTTVMLKNIPNNYTRDMLIEMLDSEGLSGQYDFVYLPMDLNRDAGLGYAFVNMISHAAATLIQERLNGFASWKVPSEKVCDICWAKPLQGLAAHLNRYRNSPMMHEDVAEKYKPLYFVGGERAPLPPPTKSIRAPRIKRHLVLTQEEESKLEYM